MLANTFFSFLFWPLFVPSPEHSTFVSAQEWTAAARTRLAPVHRCLSYSAISYLWCYQKAHYVRVAFRQVKSTAGISLLAVCISRWPFKWIHVNHHIKKEDKNLDGGLNRCSGHLTQFNKLFVMNFQKHTPPHRQWDPWSYSWKCSHWWDAWEVERDIERDGEEGQDSGGDLTFILVGRYSFPVNTVGFQ